MEYPKYPSLIIHLKQILHSRKTKAEIDTGNTIEYDVKSYQVKKTIVTSIKRQTNLSTRIRLPNRILLFYMTLQIATPHQAARLKITLTKMRKPPSHTTQSFLMMTKSVAPQSAARETIDSTIADMDYYQ